MKLHYKTRVSADSTGVGYGWHWLWLVLALLSATLITGCDNSNDDGDRLTLPTTPPDLTLPPSDRTTAAQVANGTATGRVLMNGQLTRVKSSQDHEWWFDDASGPEIEMDFSSAYVPPVGTNFTAYGDVDKGDSENEVDIIAWEPGSYTGTPPSPSPGPNPEIPAEFTSVAEILSGGFFGQMVLVRGRVTRLADDDHNELVFTDGTGEIELDFPSNNVPALGSSIIAYGSVSSGPEIDVYAWQHQ